MMPPKRSRRTSERRTKPRADARLSMRVETTPDTETPQIVTESQNISASGVYCTSSHFLAPLSKVALTIVLPKVPGARPRQELIKCEGIVVRCQPMGKKSERSYELACMFSSMSPEHRMMIDEFVSWRSLQALHAATSKPALNGRARTRKKAAATRTRTKAKSAAKRRTVH
jgi:hypothetical protein